MISKFYVIALIFAVQTVLKRLEYLYTWASAEKTHSKGRGLKFARVQSPSVSFVIFFYIFLSNAIALLISKMTAECGLIRRCESTDI